MDVGARGPGPGEEDSLLGPRSPCSPSCFWSPLPWPPTGQDASSLMPACRPGDTGPLSVPTGEETDSPRGTALTPLGPLTPKALRIWPQPLLPAHRSCCVSTSLFASLPECRVSHGHRMPRATAQGVVEPRHPLLSPSGLRCWVWPSEDAQLTGACLSSAPGGPGGLPAGLPGTWAAPASRDDQHSLH